MDWRERIRNLWIERAVWMRHYIISLMMGLRDLSFVAARLLRNGTDIARAISYYYGDEVAIQAENLFTQNVLLLSELSSTIKSGGSIEPMIAGYDAIGSGLLELLAQANPNLDKTVWEAYIKNQFNLQLDLLRSLSQGQYSEGITNFDLAYDNATRIARQMIDGIEAQFGLGTVSA